MARNDLTSRLRGAAEALGPATSQRERPGRSYSNVPGDVVTATERVNRGELPPPYGERDSECVKNFSYDPNRKSLYITYPNGGRYAYSGVSQETYMKFATSPSLGGYVNSTIKKYPCRWVSGPPRVSGRKLKCS
jgi:hypothetical protein